jgi:hypothetical protein
MTTDNTDYALALGHLVPNAQWAMDNNDYDNIQWLDEEIAQPTKAALKTAATQAQAILDAKVNARSSALAKLADLGLTAEEIAAL